MFINVISNIHYDMIFNFIYFLITLLFHVYLYKH